MKVKKQQLQTFFSEWVLWYPENLNTVIEIQYIHQYIILGKIVLNTLKPKKRFAIG